MKTLHATLLLILILISSYASNAQLLSKSCDFETDKMSTTEDLFPTEKGFLLVLVNKNAISNATIFEVAALDHQGKFQSKSEFNATGNFGNYAFAKSAQLGQRAYVVLGKVQGGTLFNSEPVLIEIDNSGKIIGPVNFSFQPKEVFRSLTSSPQRKRLLMSTDKRWIMLDEQLNVQWEIVKKNHEGKFEQTADWCINDDGAMAYLNAPKSGRKKGIIQTEMINSKGEFLSPVIWSQKVDDDNMPYFGIDNLIVATDGSFVLVTSTLALTKKTNKLMEDPTDWSILILNPETGESNEILHHQYGINNAGVLPHGRTVLKTAHKSADGIWHFTVRDSKINEMEYWHVSADGSVSIQGGKQKRESSLATIRFDQPETGFSGFFSMGDQVDKDFVGSKIDIQSTPKASATNENSATFHLVLQLNGKVYDPVAITQFTTDDMIEYTGYYNYKIVHNPLTNSVVCLMGKAAKGSYQVFHLKMS